ncbi:hypothetical protein GCM10009828_052290 [Actinoplanes couchii]|uniref:Ig-like domain-containing protein n=1 Tax=Actinoplanes couchii TaxID=403638 RepID=A0ABQ3XN81_9ACTN|nr:hypothetical protein Aco03nite_083730 [Actinoplanes couchii]
MVPKRNGESRGCRVWWAFGRDFPAGSGPDAVVTEVEICSTTAERPHSRISRVRSPLRDSPSTARFDCEAKGRTAATGLDVDWLYGQLLRRVSVEPRPNLTFGVVGTMNAASAAQRFPP